MSKRLGGALDFYAQKRARIAEAQKKVAPEVLKEETTGENIAAVADNIADIKLTLPVEEKDKQIPVAEEETSVGPITPERAELIGKVGEDIPAVATPSKASEVLGGVPIPKQTDMGEDLYTDTTTVPGKEKVELYKEQLEEEAQMRITLDDEGAKDFGEMVDTRIIEEYQSKKTSDDENADTQNFSNMLDAAAKSFQVDQNKFNIFGKLIDTSTMGSEFSADPMGFLKKNSDEISYAIKGFDKLNMLEDPSDPNSNIRPEVGRAALIATILELSQRLNQQAEETDKEVNKRQYDDALDRTNIGKAVGSRIERLLYPSANIDPNKPYTGESEGFGFEYRLNERERSLLGQAVIQGFADSPNFNFMESFFIKAPGEDKGKWSFRPDREGDQQLWAIRRALKDIMGLNGYDRPVSLVPTTSEGRLIGEGAVTQKQITSQLIKNELPPKVKESIRLLGRVAHTTPPHKILLGLGFLNSDSLFFNQVQKKDSTYYDKKYNEFLKEYKARSEADPSFTPRSLGDFDTFEQAANRQTIDIMDRHKERYANTMSDAIKRMDRSFFYGYTAINNSSRLMITNQELNYQADKFSRFLVDGAKPVVFKKNSNSSIEMSPDGFMGVLARSIIPEAGKMPPERQVALLLQDIRDPSKSKYIKLGKELLNFTERTKKLISYYRNFKGGIQEERLSEAEQDAKYDRVVKQTGSVNAWFSSIFDPEFDLKEGSDVVMNQFQITQEILNDPLSVSPELEAYLKEMGKDEFWFAMDALHELARWDATPTGTDFKTRVKAEADGNANGATILGFQMGVENILEKGGVLYSKKRLKLLDEGLTHSEIEEIEQDIRDDVFTHMTAMPQIDKDTGTWDGIFKRIKQQKKVKELMKQPIMTSIYGKDAKYHSDTAKKFIQDNPELFNSFHNNIPEAEKILTKYLEHALVTGLGGALEHSRIAKRMGRAFNFANRIAMIEGPNGFMSQAGGYEYINDTPEPTAFDFAEEGMTDKEGNLRRRSMLITTKRRIPSAQAKAGGVKLDTGLKSITDHGSKLRNQVAVNSTQNIDSSIAQDTAVDILSEDPTATFMQIYDAFMGDAASFGKIRRQANKNFIKINTKYELVQKEIESFDNLKKEISKEVGKKKASGEMYDIGLEGDYRSLGDFVLNAGRIIGRDMPEDNDYQIDRKEKAFRSNKAKEMRGIAAKYDVQLPAGNRVSADDYQEMKSIMIPPDLYLELINYAFKTLNIESDLQMFLSKVRKKRKEILKERKLREGQYS